MKKKNPLRKLVLNRETLVELDRMNLEHAAGGAPTRFCPYSGYNTCGTCEATCTTNLC